MKTLKKFVVIIILALSGIAANAQFSSAMLQASGLTCAMCTKAINKSLEALPFIQTVKADIKNSAFNIVFKPNMSVDIDKMKNAVADAGFSVARLKLTGNFQHVAVKNDEHVVINGKTYHFLKVKDQTLDGNKEITIVDKNFLTGKEFKKYSLTTQMHCIATGKAATCCEKDGVSKDTRIYHVTI